MVSNDDKAFSGWGGGGETVDVGADGSKKSSAARNVNVGGTTGEPDTRNFPKFFDCMINEIGQNLSEAKVR